MTLFDAANASPAGEVDPFDFGTDTRPKGKPSPGFRRPQKSAFLAMVGDDPERTGIDPSAKKRAKTNPSDETKKIREYLDSLGEFGFKVEHYEDAGYGAKVKKDVLGIIDWISLKEGRVTGWQITTKEQVMPHISKMASTATVKVAGRGEPTYRENTLKWLDAGCHLVILGWYRDDKGHWAMTRTDVTRAVIEAAIARKRK